MIQQINPIFELNYFVIFYIPKETSFKGMPSGIMCDVYLQKLIKFLINIAIKTDCNSLINPFYNL